MSYKLVINYFLQCDFYSEHPKDIKKSEIIECIWAEEEALYLEKVLFSLSTTDYDNLRQSFSDHALGISSNRGEGGSK